MQSRLHLESTVPIGRATYPHFYRHAAESSIPEETLQPPLQKVKGTKNGANKQKDSLTEITLRLPLARPFTYLNEQSHANAPQ